MSQITPRDAAEEAHDDDAAPPKLPVFVRFADLVSANIVRNWPTLQRLIDEDGFPLGVMIGRNTRAWPLEAVERWLASRPTARKEVHGHKVYDGQQVCIGFTVSRGKAGVEAFDIDNRSLGIFPDQKSAAAAVSARRLKGDEVA